MEGHVKEYPGSSDEEIEDLEFDMGFSAENFDFTDEQELLMAEAQLFLFATAALTRQAIKFDVINEENTQNAAVAND